MCSSLSIRPSVAAIETSIGLVFSSIASGLGRGQSLTVQAGSGKTQL
jgi:hypothetical protein